VTTRADIATAARKYVGTPFKHQGRIEGLAIDCVGLVLCAGEDLGLRDLYGAPFLRSDYPDYSSQPTDRFVYDELVRRAILKPIGAKLVAGNILGMRIPRLPCHAAIVTERDGMLYMIHAYDSGPRECAEHILSQAWRNRIVGAFDFPGVTE
jgi:hypothetical protein